MLGTSMPDGVAITSMRSLIAARAEARRLGLMEPGRVLSTQAGGHLSAFRGAGIEYDESRVYVPGDDPRSMDWRHTARAGRPHVKLFREERERALLLLVDQRAGMRFATRVAFKSVIAAHAAALLGWAAVDQGERVGGMVFDEHTSVMRRPVARSQGLLGLLRALAVPSARQPGGFKDIDMAVEQLRRLPHAGGVACIVSDFNEMHEGFAWLSRLGRRAEVMLISVHDPIEETAPPSGRYPVLVPQGRHVLDTSSEGRRVWYERGFQRRRQALTQAANRAGAHLLSLRTDWPVGRTLARGLGVPAARPR